MAYYNEKGIKRFTNAILFSIAGFKATWKHEEAFRQEVVVFICIVPLALWLAGTNVEKVLLIGSVVLVLLMELVNSSIEAVVDRISDEHHELSGRAKDIGSAAVMLSIFLSIATWLLILV